MTLARGDGKCECGHAFSSHMIFSGCMLCSCGRPKPSALTPWPAPGQGGKNWLRVDRTPGAAHVMTTEEGVHQAIMAPLGLSMREAREMTATQRVVDAGVFVFVRMDV